MSEGINIIALAARAKRLGYCTPEQIARQLEAIIEDNVRYISRPYRAGRAFNVTVDKNNTILAAAIVLIESLCGQGGEP